MAITTALTFSGLLVTCKTLALIYFPYKTKDPIDVLIEGVFKRFRIHLCQSTRELAELPDNSQRVVGPCLDNIPIVYLLYVFLKTKTISRQEHIRLLCAVVAMLSICDLARSIFSTMLPNKLSRFIVGSYHSSKNNEGPLPLSPLPASDLEPARNPDLLKNR
jgi:hypothetical protein